MDSRFLRASTAAAVCAAGSGQRTKRGARPTRKRGGFTVCGRRLLSLSAHHFDLLEELKSPLIFGGESEPLDLVIISRVCGAERPVVALDAADPALRAELDACEAAFDAELVAVKAWLNLVYFSTPALLKLAEHEANADKITTRQSHMPSGLWIVQAILRESRGHTFDDLYYRTPYAWLLWLYEAMREQRDDMPWTTPRGEPEPDLTPEEEEAAVVDQQALDQRAAHVETYCQQLWAKFEAEARRRTTNGAQGVSEEEYKAEQHRIWEVEFPRLLGLAAANQLHIVFEEAKP